MVAEHGKAGQPTAQKIQGNRDTRMECGRRGSLAETVGRIELAAALGSSSGSGDLSADSFEHFFDPLLSVEFRLRLASGPMHVAHRQFARPLEAVVRVSPVVTVAENVADARLDGFVQARRQEH